MSVNVEEIRARARLVLAADKWRDLMQLLEHDIPILIAEVERLREELAETKRTDPQPRMPNNVVRQPLPPPPLKVRTEGRLLTPQQFGDEIGLKVATVRSWVLRRKINVVRVGRAVRIPCTEVERLMKEGFTPARLTRD
jgi:excisionase family DNA binding protein